MLIPAGPPLIGTVHDPGIDHTSFVTNATLDVYLFSLFPANVPAPPMGTLRCSPPFYWLFRAPTDSFGLSLPADGNHVGLRLCIFGASFDPSGDFFLTNALDVTIGSI